MKKFYKTIENSEFHKNIKKHLKLKPLFWEIILPKMNEYLGENLKQTSDRECTFVINLDEIKNPENRKLFTKDGTLNKRSKKSKEAIKYHKQLIEENGLKNYEHLGLIRFNYGIMRSSYQEMETYMDKESGIMYINTNFDFFKQKKYGYESIEEITEIEYHEHYLELIK